MQDDLINETSSRYRGWRVVAASAAALAFGPSTIAVLSLGLFMRSFEQEFGWSRTQVAIATTIVSYMIVLVSPLQGWLIDRYGSRRVILCSIPAFGTGICALALLPPVLWMYYAAWVIIPILGVGVFPLSYLKVVGSWFTRRLGFALGVANSGVAIGSMLIPLLVGYLIAQHGWRYAWLGLGVIVLLFTLPLALGFIHEAAEGRVDNPAARGRSGPGVAFAEAVRTRTFSLLIVSFLLMGTTTTAFVVHQVPLLLDRGVTPATASLVQVVFGAFGLLGRLLTGWLLDRVRASRVMITFLLGGALACALYAMGVSRELAFVCAALFGLLFGAEFDVLAYLVKRRFGALAFGRIYGLVFSVFQFGAGLGALLLPLSRDQTGSYAVGMMTFAVLLVLASLAFAAIADSPHRSRIADEPH
ncbi:MAG: MFS transporter [Steroidobacteraceae bacterium]